MVSIKLRYGKAKSNPATENLKILIYLSRVAININRLDYKRTLACAGWKAHIRLEITFGINRDRFVIDPQVHSRFCDTLNLNEEEVNINCLCYSERNFSSSFDLH